MRILWSFGLFAPALLIVASAPVQAAPLTIVEVGAPAVNCLYDTSCTITVNDTTGNIPVSGAAKNGFLQSRTFKGFPGAPAADKNGFEYRVSMTPAAAIAAPCVAALKINFGPILRFQYKTGSPPADVYVVTSGGLGTISLASADQVGGVITFVFERPVCAGAILAKSETSYFFGLTAAGAPKPITAQLQLTGGALLSLPARVPEH
jgi:hypothetical protein